MMRKIKIHELAENIADRLYVSDVIPMTKEKHAMEVIQEYLIERLAKPDYTNTVIGVLETLNEDDKELEGE